MGTSTLAAPAITEEKQNQPGTVIYDIDPTHAAAQFKVRHLMVANVRGELGEVAGRALVDLVDVTRSEVFASIDTCGITTRNADRDQHLRSSDFLDVEKHPSITFRSTRMDRLEGGELEIIGELTIRGVTRLVVLTAELSDEVRDPWGNVKRGVWATARIDRKDFGVSWNATLDGGGLIVGEMVDISIELELVRRAG